MGTFGFFGVYFSGVLGVLVDVSDIFYFFCSGDRKGESKAPGGGGGGRFLIENPRGGGGLTAGGGGGARGREGVCGKLGRGGGAKFFFFRGRNSHQGVFSGDPEFQASGFFFGIFRGNSGSGHLESLYRQGHS